MQTLTFALIVAQLLPPPEAPYWSIHIIYAACASIYITDITCCIQLLLKRKPAYWILILPIYTQVFLMQLPGSHSIFPQLYIYDTLGSWGVGWMRLAVVHPRRGVPSSGWEKDMRHLLVKGTFWEVKRQIKCEYCSHFAQYWVLLRKLHFLFLILLDNRLFYLRKKNWNSGSLNTHKKVYMGQKLPPPPFWPKLPMACVLGSVVPPPLWTLDRHGGCKWRNRGRPTNVHSPFSLLGN